MTKGLSAFVRQTGALGEALKTLDLLNSPAIKPTNEISRQLTAIDAPQADAAMTLARRTERLPAPLSRPSSEFSGAARGLSEVGEDRSGRRAPGAAAHQAVVSVAALGGFVRATRLRMGLTQQELADMAGVGRRFISELEAGKPTVETGKVLQVCASVGVDLFAEVR